MMMRAVVVLALAVVSLLSSAPTQAQQCLQVPASGFPVSSIYGWRFHPTLKRWRPHRGTDFAIPTGTPLRATHAGVVQVAFSGGGGNEVRIITEGGMVTRYLHLTRSAVPPGTQVAAGEVVAISGNTGSYTTGAHLHLEAQWPTGAPTDPEQLLCQPVPRRAGAHISQGHVIRPCNPVEGACHMPASPVPPPGSIPPGAIVPGSAAGGLGNSRSGTLPEGPPISRFDDMSTHEILASEVHRRFSNPEWHRQTAERGTVPLLIDNAQMRALSEYMTRETLAIQERVSMLLAARLARNNRSSLEGPISRQREAAMRQAGPADARAR